MPEFGREPPAYLSEKVRVGKLTREDADMILMFVNSEAGMVGHAVHTTLSNTRYISQTVEVIPHPQMWTNDTINRFVAGIRGKYKANTTRKFIVLIKRFCLWLIERGLNRELVTGELAKIKAPAGDKITKTSAMMLSTDEIDKIVSSCRNTRDRCMISVLSESGMRPFEVLNLKWKDLKIDDYGCVINCAGKTGVPRFIRLVHSSPYISQWRNDHPFPREDSFIFVSLKDPKPDARITHTGLKKVVRLATQRAGIVKKISPYIFRHSSVTRMLEEGYSDSTIRMIHWGSQSTSMLTTYGHVSNPAIDAEVLAMSGIKKDQKKKERKPVNQCDKCQMIVLQSMTYCPRCSSPLTEDAREQRDRELRMIVKDIMDELRQGT